MPVGRGVLGSAAAGDGSCVGRDLVEETVFERFGGGEPLVAVVVLEDGFHGLAGLVRRELGHDLLHVEDQLGLDLDVRRRAADAAGGLVHQDAGVRGGVALALGAGGQQELSHGGSQAGGDGNDVIGDELHGVVDGHAGGHRAAGRVDVEVDVLVGVLGGKQQQL